MSVHDSSFCAEAPSFPFYAEVSKTSAMFLISAAVGYLKKISSQLLLYWIIWIQNRSLSLCCLHFLLYQLLLNQNSLSYPCPR